MRFVRYVIGAMVAFFCLLSVINVPVHFRTAADWSRFYAGSALTPWEGEIALTAATAFLAYLLLGTLRHEPGGVIVDATGVRFVLQGGETRTAVRWTDPRTSIYLRDFRQREVWKSFRFPYAVWATDKYGIETAALTPEAHDAIVRIAGECGATIGPYRPPGYFYFIGGSNIFSLPGERRLRIQGALPHGKQTVSGP